MRASSERRFGYRARVRTMSTE